MTRFYIKGATRMYQDKLVEAWIEAEENLGLKNSIYFWDNGRTQQWVDSEEAEKFHEWTKKRLSEDSFFENVCDNYFKALRN